MSDTNPSSYDQSQPQSSGSAPDPQGDYQQGGYQQGGYQQGGYQQGGYQQPAHLPTQSGAYGQPYGALPEHPQGTTILVLGIVGLFITICAPIAWYMGSKAQKEIAASGMRYANEQNINIGKILGMVLTILAIIGIVIAIVVVVFVVIIGVSQGG